MVCKALFTFGIILFFIHEYKVDKYYPDQISNYNHTNYNFSRDKHND